jgi:hypothetical protein
VIVSSADALTLLSEQIDVASIPEQYGGKFKSQHGMTPELDDGLKKHLGVNALPPGPLKWTVTEDGVRTAVAVGSSKGLKRHGSVADSSVGL